MPSPKSSAVVRIAGPLVIVVSVFYLLADTAYFGGGAKGEITNPGWLVTTHLRTWRRTDLLSLCFLRSGAYGERPHNPSSFVPRISLFHGIFLLRRCHSLSFESLMRCALLLVSGLSTCTLLWICQSWKSSYTVTKILSNNGLPLSHRFNYSVFIVPSLSKPASQVSIPRILNVASLLGYRVLFSFLQMPVLLYTTGSLCSWTKPLPPL